LARRAAVVMASPVSLAVATAPAAVDFERDEPREERDDALRDVPLAGDRPVGACEPELFDRLLFCPLCEADLLLAIPHLSLLERRPPEFPVPALYAHNRNLRVSEQRVTTNSR
jgi:hypothetical protein